METTAPEPFQPWKPGVWSRFLNALSLIFSYFVRAIDWIVAASARDGSISAARYAWWVAVNLAVLLGLFYFLERSWVFYGAAAFLGLHAGIIVSALLIIREETRLWTGLIEREECRFPRASSTRQMAFLAVATVILLLGASLLLQHLDRFTGLPRLAVRPDFSCQQETCRYFEYLTACLSEVPFFSFLAERYDIKWLPEALTFRLGFFAAMGTWTYSAFQLLYHQSGNVNELLHALANSKDTVGTKYLQMRAARAPGFLIRRMIGLALKHPDPIARRRYITIFYHAKALTFPQTFIYNLATQNRENKEWGLRQSKLLLQEEAEAFSPEYRRAIIDTICYQLKYRDHEPAIVKDLWDISRVLREGLSGSDLAYADSRLNAVAADRLEGSVNGTASQMVLIDLALEDELTGFPQTFLHYLHKHSDEVVKHGLAAINSGIEAGLAINKEKVRAGVTRALRGRPRKDVRNLLLATRQLAA